jgi:putative hydrolase of the HAD superfamily
MKAIIFDFDGTIVDTEHSELAAWEHIYSQYNHTLPVHLWKKRVGADPANFDPLQYLESMINIASEREMILAAHQLKLDELVASLKPLPGVLDWVQTADQLGIRLCVASAAPRDWVMGHLNRLGLLKHFEYVFTANDVKLLKPNPEVYQLALKKLGVASEDAIAIEDSPTGATAALAADLRCVIVPNRTTVDMVFPEGFHKLNNLQELSLQQFIDQVILKNLVK